MTNLDAREREVQTKWRAKEERPWTDETNADRAEQGRKMGKHAGCDVCIIVTCAEQHTNSSTQAFHAGGWARVTLSLPRPITCPQHAHILGSDASPVCKCGRGSASCSTPAQSSPCWHGTQTATPKHQDMVNDAVSAFVAHGLRCLRRWSTWQPTHMLC